jgi:hypothetical protein
MKQDHYIVHLMTYAYAVWLCSPFEATVMQQDRQKLRNVLVTNPGSLRHCRILRESDEAVLNMK